MYDVIVIGNGPAGLSAAVNVRQRGGTVVVIGAPLEGNPLWKAEKIDNYLGLPGLSGEKMLRTFEAHARQSGAELVDGRVLNTMYTGTGWMVSAGTELYEAYALVFAGGIVRGAKYPGEEEFLGRGVSYCATCDGMLWRGKRTTVIAFSEADRKEADFLAGIGCKVTFLLSPKQVTVSGGKAVERVNADGTDYPTDCVFILRPSVAPTELFPGLALENGYVRVGRDMATNLPGLYAAGDCTGTPLQVANAVGDGLVAGQRAMAYARRVQKGQ